jgi:trans-2,3-dihydro-3-hydroxyanthranilate isomerase
LGRHRFTLLDVFTAERLTGNGLAVVHDADGLDADLMQRFAREMQLSETSFVQTARAGGDYRHRIFTPTGEIPFAGHPSLGAAVAVARARGEQRARLVQETQPGQQPVDVELDGDAARASMLQEPTVFGDEVDPAVALAAVGLHARDADPDLGVQFVSTGVFQLVACIRDRARLASVRPDYGVIPDLLGPMAAITLYVAAVDRGAGTAVARSFMRAEIEGEDPATGSAVGPLQALVAERAGVERLEVVQGVEMGRRSVLRTSVEGDRVRVGGDAVLVVEGEVVLDI